MRKSATEGFASDNLLQTWRAQQATVFPRTKKLEEI
jgi:hypothetical protein